MSSPADNILISCDPAGNSNRLQYGILRVRIRVRQRQPVADQPFKVIIRTNLNQAHRIRRQFIDRVEKGQSYSTDFQDIAAAYNPRSDEYGVDVLLHEVGYFEYKVRVASTQKQNPWVKWADGANVGVSVTPLPYGRENSIYCAFIRQFGSNKHLTSLENVELEETVKKLESQGACVIPPGGNFQNFIEVLPFIVGKLGMKIIHLLPINPVPSSYGRMGMYGSPYATTDYFGIEHTYATFSRYQTIEDQFIDLTSTIHGLGAKVFLDMVVNHTGWASSINFTHPHWHVVDENRKIVSPGAWGVVWGDLVELDYGHRDLWQYMAEVFLTWCRRGIDGFRLDAGYMVPMEVWQYIISKVREEYPNTLFLLEGLGGPWETTERLLTRGQMNWAYSELFQNYSREEVVEYLGYAQQVSAGKGVLVHYAETHDNDRLAKKGKTYTRMRLYLSALTSFSGSWGFTNGVEWLATEKIDVHRNTGLNWGGVENLVEDIALLNRVMAENPAFWEHDNVDVVDVGHGDVLAFSRTNADGDNVIAAMINLNAEAPASYGWDLGTARDMKIFDFLGDRVVDGPEDGWLRGELGPGEVMLYRLNEREEARVPAAPAVFEVDYDKITLVYQILLSQFEPHEVGRIDQEKLLREATDFRKFIALVNQSSLNRLIRGSLEEALAAIGPDEVEDHSAVWTFRDSSRAFILSGDKWLVVHTFLPCSAYLKTEGTTLSMESIPSADGLGHFSFFPPQPENQRARLTFYWKIQREGMIHRQWQEQEYPILSVPSGRKARRQRQHYPLRLEKSELEESHSKLFLTNGIGGLAQVPATPYEINSKYDTLLAIAPDASHPTDRLSVVKTVKETIQVGQKYFDLDESFFTSLVRYPQPTWEFVYDDGEYLLRIQRSLVMSQGHDSLSVRYKVIEANAPLTLISKFYVEWRSLHEPLKASDATRAHYDRSMHPLADEPGFAFEPDGGLQLRLVARQGEYIEQPHWICDLDLQEDAQRGLAGRSDAFAPGFFQCEMHQGNSQVITATVERGVGSSVLFQKSEINENKRIKGLVARVAESGAHKDPTVKMLICALDQFLVKAGDHWLVTAGLPWLGHRVRDGLQCVGGLLAAGRDEVVRDVIRLSAETEDRGLLRDWLGGDSGSRTNTEASLRLILAAQHYVDATGDLSLWDEAVRRDDTLREIAGSIFHHFTGGDGHGPSRDEPSALLYSPSGFTWMDTTHPQATPRGGYPVEVQALWYEALGVVAEVCPDVAEQATHIQETLAEKFMGRFWDVDRHYLADVLLLTGKGGAAEAIPDSALRFNQLAALHAGLVPTAQARQVLENVGGKLLVPAGLRSLAEDLLAVPLEIMDAYGTLLADPRIPYCGQCAGDETARRVAYHNGTAWPMAYPSYIEAQARVCDFSDSAVKQGLAFFEPLWAQLKRGGIGTLPEMIDGNYPHTPRGCFAHAASVAETLRVYIRLKYPTNRSVPQAKDAGAMAQTR